MNRRFPCRSATAGTSPVLPVLLLCFAMAGCDGSGSQDDAGERISLAGTLEARERDVGFQVGGRIAALHVDEGSQVGEGQLIAELAPTDYELSLQRAQADADAARQALAALEAGTRPLELKVAEARVASARAELDFAQAEEQRIARLLGQSMASQEQLDEVRLRRNVAAAGVAQAEEQLALLREGPRAEDVARAQAQYSASKATLALAEQRLDYTRLRSPADGVVSVRLAEAGQVVAAGQPVFRISDLSTPWVRAYLREGDLPRVTLGQAVEVRVDGLPDQVFEGRLSFISPQAEFTPKTVETRALRVDLVYRVKVDVANDAGLLKIGMPADLSLEVPDKP